MSGGESVPAPSSPDNQEAERLLRRGMEWRPAASSAAKALLSAAVEDLGTEAERLARSETLDIVNEIHVVTAARNIKLRREGAASNLLLAIGGLVAGACLGYLPTAVTSANPTLLALTVIGVIVGAVVFTSGAMLAILRRR